MPKTPAIMPEQLRQLLDYDPNTGVLVWKYRSREWFKSDRSHSVWNRRFAGKQAFTAKDAYGYHIGSVDSYATKAHRVAWALHTGEWPAGDLDHIDHDKANNRIANLREAGPPLNNKNRPLQRNNTSGVNGVRWHKLTSKWVATIRVGGADKHLGLFNSKDEAIKARQAFDQSCGFHPNHGKEKV